MRRTPSVRPSKGLEFRSLGLLQSHQPISMPGLGSVHSRLLAGATVYDYTFLLATPRKAHKRRHASQANQEDPLPCGILIPRM